MNNMDWVIEDNSLKKDFEFSNSSKAMKFINDATIVASENRQSPDIHINAERFVSITIPFKNNSSISEDEIRLANLINRIG